MVFAFWMSLAGLFFGGCLLKLQVIYGFVFPGGCIVLLTQTEGNYMDTWHYCFMVSCELSDT